MTEYIGISSGELEEQRQAAGRRVDAALLVELLLRACCLIASPL